MDRHRRCSLDGSRCAESVELNESLKPLQFVQATPETAQCRKILHACAAKSWREEFAKKLSGEQHVVKVTDEHGRHRKTDGNELVAALITSLKDQLRTIDWLNSKKVGISCEEEAVEWTVEDHENVWDNMTGMRWSPEAV